MVGLAGIEPATSALSGRSDGSRRIPMGVDPSHSILVRWLARVCSENQRDSTGRSGSQLLGQSWGRSLVGPLPKSSWDGVARTQAGTTGLVDKSEVLWQDIPCYGVGARDGHAARCDDLIKETLMSLLFVPEVDASKFIGQAATGVMYVVAGASLIGAVLDAELPALRVRRRSPGTPKLRRRSVLSL